MNEADLRIDLFPSGKTRSTVKVWTGDKLIHADTLAVMNAAQRERFIKAVMGKAPGMDAADLEVRLLEVADRSKCGGDGEAKPRPCAVFAGLVDIVRDDENRPLFLFLKDGELHHAPTVERDGETLTPPERKHYQWHLPRLGRVLAHVHDDDGRLYGDVRVFLEGVSDLPTPEHYDLLTAWAFHTWLTEPAEYSPLIAFYAVPERGKSRTGKALTYLARRGLHQECLRESYIFRASRDWEAVLFLDVLDLWKKAEKLGSEDLILGRYERGMTVPRVLRPDAGAFEDTEHFPVFGPTILATNEPLHEILETRCISITMPEARRNFPDPVRPEAVLPLKERLCAWRARTLGRVLADVDKPAHGRLGDIIKPLFQIIALVKPDALPALQRVLRVVQDERRAERSKSIEARVLQAILDLEAEICRGKLPLKDITATVNEGQPERMAYGEKKIGGVLRGLGFPGTRSGANGSTEIHVDLEHLDLSAVKYGLRESEASGHVLGRASERSEPSDDPPQAGLFDGSGPELTERPERPRSECPIENPTEDVDLAGEAEAVDHE